METLNITYLAGSKKGTKAEITKALAESLIADGLAEASKDANTELDVAMEALTKSLTASMEAQIGVLEKKLIKNLNVGIDKARISTRDLSDDDSTCGFKNIGDFASAVRKKTLRMGDPDERLLKMAVRYKADGMDESVLADGGALVPTEYSTQLYRDVFEESILFQKARKFPITTGNSLFVPVRSMTELGVTAAAGGSLGSWLNADGVPITPQKPVYNRRQFTLNRWGTLLPVTDELLQDNNVALASFINDEGGIALAWDLNQAFVNGTGTAQPQGILASSALSIAPADTNQVAYTISYSNLVNMKSLLWLPRPGDFTGVTWIANPDAEAQFEQLKDAAGRNLYYAAGTIQQTPTPRLFGLPVLYSYHCPPVGSGGDVILADMNQYGVATKAGGQVEQAMSMHLYFDSAEIAYRILYRIDGKTMRTGTLQVPNSPNARSGFVCLAARGGAPAS